MGCTSSAAVKRKVAPSSEGAQDFSFVVPGHVPIKSSDFQSFDRIKDSFHGDFVLYNRIGEGAFGTVYSIARATGKLQPDNGKLAVKIVDIRMREEEEEVCRTKKQLIQKEVEILCNIGRGCKNCIAMEAYYVESPFVYMVFERASMTLFHHLNISPDLGEQVLARVFAEMLTGLSYVHKLRLVHRDIKPDNFLCFGPDCTVKMCDFGLSKRLTDSRPLLEGACGTAPYMSPEMLLAFGYDEKTDVWSFAVIVYVLFFGTFPSEPSELTKGAIKAAIIKGLPEPTFRSHSDLEDGTVSDGAQDFAKFLLVRDPTFRSSAQEALRHPWLQEASCRPPTRNSVFMHRQLLSSAQRVGAFELSIDPVCARPTNLDKEMSSKQECEHGHLWDSRIHNSVASSLKLTPASSREASSGTSSRLWPQRLFTSFCSEAGAAGALAGDVPQFHKFSPGCVPVAPRSAKDSPRAWAVKLVRDLDESGVEPDAPLFLDKRSRRIRANKRCFWKGSGDPLHRIPPG